MMTPVRAILTLMLAALCFGPPSGAAAGSKSDQEARGKLERVQVSKNG
ncbi:MAG: hypothetical protein ACO1SX_10575 [Actinomycetota bacterium]